MNAPTRIGRYEIVRRLGKSMTDVYLAMDTVENRKVALKLIRHGGDRASQLVHGGGASRRCHPEGTARAAIRAWWRSTNTAIWTAISSSPCSTWRDARWRRCWRADQARGSVPGRRDRSRDLRATGQVSLLGTVRWCMGTSSRRTSTWGPTTRCACWISESPRRCARIATPPCTTSAARAIARRSG